MDQLSGTILCRRVGVRRKICPDIRRCGQKPTHIFCFPDAKRFFFLLPCALLKQDHGQNDSYKQPARHDTYVDMESGLRVEVTSLSGESVLLVNVVAYILEDLTQVLPPGHRHRTLLWTLRYRGDFTQ